MAWMPPPDGIAMCPMMSVEAITEGRWRQLERLEGELTPQRVFATIPGFRPTLFRRLADTLDVDTLQELETSLRTRKAEVPDIGPRCRSAIFAALEQRLSGILRMHGRSLLLADEPPVALLLDVDRLYRRKAEKGELTLIAPRRFNPTGAAWLPILHARRRRWHITALFSNTARAHELEHIQDWVVIFFHRN